MTCDVCGRSLVDVDALVIGGPEGELNLCRPCGDSAFPGLRDRMRSSCPVCAMGGRHN